MIILPIFGLLFIGLSLLFLFKRNQISRKGVRTEGTVTDLVRREGSRHVSPVIRFQTTNNEWITKSPDFWGTGRAPQRGDTVKVIYNPDDPGDFVVEGKTNGSIPFLLIGTGMILIWAALRWQHVRF